MHNFYKSELKIKRNLSNMTLNERVGLYITGISYIINIYMIVSEKKINNRISARDVIILKPKQNTFMI